MAKRSRPNAGGSKKGRSARSRAKGASQLENVPIPSPSSLPGRTPLGMERATIPPALNDDDRRKANPQMKDNSSEPDDYMIELNLMHNGGVEAARVDFVSIFKKIVPHQEPSAVSKSYFSVRVSLDDLRRMVALDEERAKKDPAKIAIYKVWPDFDIHATLDKSISTVKADAAARSFAAYGHDIVWAVIDFRYQPGSQSFCGKSDPHACLSRPASPRFHRRGRLCADEGWLWPWHSRRRNHCGSHDPQQGEASGGLSTHLRD